jgi:molecular chaperone DnaJ
VARAFSHDVQGVRDYYKVLDVPHTATPDEIRRAYRSLALRYHPDRNGGSREAEERFKELAEAFHTLSDPERRDLYDVWGPGAPLRSTLLDDQSAGLDDAFTTFVQQFSAFLKEELPELSESVDSGPSLPPLPLRVRVTLAEVATGVTKEVSFPCPRCSGTGVQDAGSFEGWACLVCGGSGEDRGQTILVDVPAGALSGDRLRASRSQGEDVPAFVEVEEDPRFVRAGADVVLELAISARRGRASEVVVPTPTGSTRLKIPRGTPVGGALRIPGEGLPARSRAGKGDVIVKLVPEGTEGAWTVATPAPPPAAATGRSSVSKAGVVGLALLLGGVTVALLARVGSMLATASFAATTDEQSLTPAPASPVDGAAEQLSAPAEPLGAAEAAPVPRPPSLRIPAAPEPTKLTLPGAPDIASIFGDQPIASLSPIRPEPRASNASSTLSAVTQAPRVRNLDRVQEALLREYPIGLREAKVGGRVEMTFDVNAQGGVERFQIKEGSGNTQLDAAAMRVARVFEFTPALRGTERVATSVSLGITFGSGGPAALAGAGTPSTRATPNGSGQPVPADFDVAPQVSNPDRVRQSLEREYPIGLRDTGVGGYVDMWFYVNEQGVVERFQIGQGSGRAALDQAALRVARVFQFTAARRADQPVATWTSFRITFVGANPGGGAGARPSGADGE